MEHYIGNPINIVRKQAGKLIFFGGLSVIGFGVDQYDDNSFTTGSVVNGERGENIETSGAGNFALGGSGRLLVRGFVLEMPSYEKWETESGLLLTILRKRFGPLLQFNH